VIPHYPHKALISTALLVSSFTKLFPLLLLVWNYDLPSSASAVSWAVIINNVAALEILLDCGYVRAALLAAVGAVCRAGVGWVSCYAIITKRLHFTDKFAVHLARGWRGRRGCCCWCCRDWGRNRALVAVCRECGSGVALQVGIANKMHSSLSPNCNMLSSQAVRRITTVSGVTDGYHVDKHASRTAQQPAYCPYLQPAVVPFLSFETEITQPLVGTYLEQYPHLISCICTILSSTTTAHLFSKQQTRKSEAQTHATRIPSQQSQSSVENAVVNSIYFQSLLCSKHAIRRHRSAVVLGSEVAALRRYERVPLGEESDSYKDTEPLVLARSDPQYHCSRGVSRSTYPT
jgi:hypothetical protein